MAYMNQERKATFSAPIKALLKEYGLTGALSVRHHSSIVLTITKGKIDFLAGRNETYSQVNVYHVAKNYNGSALEFLEKAIAILNGGNHDKSNSQTDYFDVGWYVDVNIGKWDKPYQLEI